MKETSDRDGIRELNVRYEGAPDWESAGVWVSDNSGVRCASCSTPLRGMSGSCKHVAAAKRFLAAEGK